MKEACKEIIGKELKDDLKKILEKEVTEKENKETIQ